MARLVERGVRRGGQHHGGPLDLRVGVPGRLHGEQQGLGASRGGTAHRAGRPVQQVGCHPHQVLLHPQQQGEGGRVEPVGAAVGGQRLPPELVGLRQAGVVDVGQGAAAVGRQVVLAEPDQLPAQLLGAFTGCSPRAGGTGT